MKSAVARIEFELAKFREERQAAAAAKEQADLARIRDAEERKVAAAATKEQADLARIHDERDAEKNVRRT